MDTCKLCPVVYFSNIQFSCRQLGPRGIRNVKRLYLSGNPLVDLGFLSAPCYNLIYLELAGCRISDLPSNLADMVPNVRVLNLNYNFIADVNPLNGLVRLKRLTLVGSRLKSTKTFLKALRNMPDIEMIDVRYGLISPSKHKNSANTYSPQDESLNSRLVSSATRT